MKWLFLIVIFAVGFTGLQIYRNTEIMQRGYLLQKLNSKEKTLREKKGFLQEKLSSYLSFGKVENYARKKLSLTDPEEIRILEEKISPPRKSSSPPPLLIKKREEGIWILQIIHKFKRWLSFSVLKVKVKFFKIGKIFQR